MKRKVIVAVMLAFGMLMPISTSDVEMKAEVIEATEVVTEVKQEKIYHTYIDKEYIGYVEEISEMYNVCPELVFAIIERESSGNPNAVNGDCYGLMQVSEYWHRDRMERLGVESLFDPRGNILVGVDYLMELTNRYGDLDMVLMTYNGSSDARERWENGTPTDYATDIMNSSSELQVLHGK